MRFAYGQMHQKWRFVRKFRVKSWRTDPKIKNTYHHGTYLYHYSVGASASYLVFNRVQTSNKAHDKFVPRRDCACADHSRPSLSTALLSGWSSHLVLIRFRLTFPLSQARTPWTRQARLRSSKACVRGHDRSASHLVLIRFRLTFPLSQARTPWTRQARLRSSKACVRAHGRSASHLVLSSFILTKSFVKMPATFFSINSFASFSSSIVQMR